MDVQKVWLIAFFKGGCIRSRQVQESRKLKALHFSALNYNELICLQLMPGYKIVFCWNISSLLPQIVLQNIMNSYPCSWCLFTKLFCWKSSLKLYSACLFSGFSSWGKHRQAQKHKVICCWLSDVYFMWSDWFSLVHSDREVASKWVHNLFQLYCLSRI